MAFNKPNEIAILEISEFGPNWSGEELSNVRVNAFQTDDVGNLCRVIGGIQMKDQEANEKTAHRQSR